jgi:hypothetical protein
MRRFALASLLAAIVVATAGGAAGAADGPDCSWGASSARATFVNGVLVDAPPAARTGC